MDDQKEIPISTRDELLIAEETYAMNINYRISIIIAILNILPIYPFIDFTNTTYLTIFICYILFICIMLIMFLVTKKTKLKKYFMWIALLFNAIIAILQIVSIKSIFDNFTNLFYFNYFIALFNPALILSISLYSLHKLFKKKGFSLKKTIIINLLILLSISFLYIFNVELYFLNGLGSLNLLFANVSLTGFILVIFYFFGNFSKKYCESMNLLISLISILYAIVNFYNQWYFIINELINNGKMLFFFE